MKNLDIDIYMTNFTGFFRKNPDQLKQLIGNSDPEVFYDGVRKIVEENSKFEDRQLEPTRQQLLDLIVKLTIGESKQNTEIPHMVHHMGLICLN
jgi:hypothetical protein